MCITIDFDTLDTGNVTIRDRDTMAQESCNRNQIIEKFISKIKN